MRKELFKKVKAMVVEDFSFHRLTEEGRSTLSGLERFIHFWVFAIKSFLRNRCMVRASALAYSNLLALVPMLAIAVSVSASMLKEGGEEQKRIDDFMSWVVDIIVPPDIDKPSMAATTTETTGGATNGVVSIVSTNGVASTNAPVAEANRGLDPATRKAVRRQIDEIVANIRGGALSTGGMILLIYLVIMMLARVEDTCNDIWGVKKGRNWFARVTTYWATMTLGPLILLAVTTINSGQQMAEFRSFLDAMPGFLNKLFTFSARLIPLIVLSLAFSVFYKLMPNTKVQWRAAMVGGFCGGTLWQLNNLMFVFYVSRIVTNNKIYGSLGMIPVIMISLYLGWLFLLFGAQVAYAFQNRRAYVQDRLVEKLTPRGREIVALRLMSELAARFHVRSGSTSADELAVSIGVPSRLIVSIVESLLDDDLISETNEENPSYLPSRSLRDITFADIIRAVRNGRTGGDRAPVELGQDLVTVEYNSVIESELIAAGRTNLQEIAERLVRAAAEVSPVQNT